MTPVRNSSASRLSEIQENYNNRLAGLLNPTDGFGAWRELVSQFENAIPVLQYTDVSGQSRQILRQAALLAQTTRCLAVRINSSDDPAITSIVSQIVSIIDDPQHLLVILDCGQGRQQVTQRATFARDTMARLLNSLEIAEQSRMRAVCVSNSFPRPTHDGLREYESMDWRLWGEARDAFPFMFGDYAAVNRIRRQNTYVPADWRSTVTYPTDLEWIIYRHVNANGPQGWIEGSNEILTNSSFDNQLCWGVDLIRQAASGNLMDADSARFWMASRVNIHVHRQISFSELVINNYDSEDEP